MRRKILLVIFAVLIPTALATYFFRNHMMHLFFVPTGTVIEQGLTQETGKKEGVQIVAEHLAIPWEISFPPNGLMLVTERPGRLLSSDPP